MDINVKLDRNFTTTFNKLRNEYGEDLAGLNGFADSQLNYTEFIDNFVSSDVVADASIDGNANVGHKDIVSLENEMSKPHSKLLGFNKIFYEIQKKYGYQTAVDWLNAEWNGHFYLHDSYNTTYKPYCFSGDTKFLTKGGVKRFDEMVGQTVKVLNKNHGWESAEINSFGTAKLWELRLERCGASKTIKTTGNHKWFVRNKSDGRTHVIETQYLKPGMRIPFNTSKVWAQIEPSPFGIAHGFFIGDGYKGEHPRANFCGDKTALLPYFTPANVTGNEREYTTYGIPKYFRDLPSLDENPSYLYGFLAGYFAADGCVDDRGRCTMASGDIKNLEFVRDVLCVLGMPVNDIRSQTRVSNLTNEEGTIYILTISNECLSENFFIRPVHKERFNANKAKRDRHWIVRSVKETGEEDIVYCATTASGSFTLDNNILTHNCYAYDIEDLITKGLYFIEGFNNQPPKHLVTYTDFVAELTSWCCNRSSGAVGLPSFLVYSYYFWKKDVESGHYMLSPEYYRDQEFQRIIYKLNQPFLRGGIQSAFTNFSIFDKPYLEALFGGKEFPDGTFIIDYIDEIREYQKAFMDVVGKVRSQNVMTFPVLTYALLRVDGKFVDEEFAKWCCERNMEWADSNFFVSETVDSLSNCCRLKSCITDLGYVKMPHYSFSGYRRGTHKSANEEG